MRSLVRLGGGGVLAYLQDTLGAAAWERAAGGDESRPWLLAMLAVALLRGPRVDSGAAAEDAGSRSVEEAVFACLPALPVEVVGFALRRGFGLGGVPGGEDVPVPAGCGSLGPLTTLRAFVSCTLLPALGSRWASALPGAAAAAVQRALAAGPGADREASAAAARSLALLLAAAGPARAPELLAPGGSLAAALPAELGPIEGAAGGDTPGPALHVLRVCVSAACAAAPAPTPAPLASLARQAIDSFLSLRPGAAAAARAAEARFGGGGAAAESGAAAEDAAEEAEIREERRVLARLRLLATLLPASDVTAQDGRTHEGVEGGAR